MLYVSEAEFPQSLSCGEKTRAFRRVGMNESRLFFFFAPELDSLPHGRSNRAGRRPVDCVQVLVLQALAVHRVSLITGFAPQCVEKLEKADSVSDERKNSFSSFQLASAKNFQCQIYLLDNMHAKVYKNTNFALYRYTQQRVTLRFPNTTYGKPVETGFSRISEPTCIMIY